MKLVKETDSQDTKKVSDQEAEEAFRTILTWMGEDPSREGLLETPKRVTKAFKEYFAGYGEDANKILEKHLVMLRDMTIWLLKKIFQSQVIVNTIWHQLLVLHTLLIFQKKE
jgi:GTP cyclohydrolase I